MPLPSFWRAPSRCRRAGGPEGMDWAGLMRRGLCELKLTPAQFWALTPVELLVMLGLEGVEAPFTRARLAELAAAFPDEQRMMDHGGL